MTPDQLDAVERRLAVLKDAQDSVKAHEGLSFCVTGDDANQLLADAIQLAQALREAQGRRG